MAKKITYKPLFNMVLIKPEPDMEKVGRIFVPDQAQRTMRRDMGTVLAVGPGYWSDHGVFIKPAVKEGMQVFYSMERAFQVKDGKGERLILVREIDLMSEVSESVIETE